VFGHRHGIASGDQSVEQYGLVNEPPLECGALPFVETMVEVSGDLDGIVAADRLPFTGTRRCPLSQTNVAIP
jgi:hypothetical protein